MLVARICRAKYPSLDGKGSAAKGGRWNSAGRAVVYASSCGALAALEYRVHTAEDPGDLRLYTLEINDDASVDTAQWMPDVATAKAFGDAWIRSKRSCMLWVPSAVVPHQMNALLNPAHREFPGCMRLVRDGPFALDVRLFDLMRG